VKAFSITLSEPRGVRRERKSERQTIIKKEVGCAMDNNETGKRSVRGKTRGGAKHKMERLQSASMYIFSCLLF
jgi:hypothetical protein